MSLTDSLKLRIALPEQQSVGPLFLVRNIWSVT